RKILCQNRSVLFEHAVKCHNSGLNWQKINSFRDRRFESFLKAPFCSSYMMQSKTMYMLLLCLCCQLKLFIHWLNLKTSMQKTERYDFKGENAMGFMDELKRNLRNFMKDVEKEVEKTWTVDYQGHRIEVVNRAKEEALIIDGKTVDKNQRQSMFIMTPF